MKKREFFNSELLQKAKRIFVATGKTRGNRILDLEYLTQAQIEFAMSTERHTMIGGPHGGGKAYIVRKVIEQYALDNSNAKICVFGVDPYALHTNFIKPMSEDLKRKAKFGKWPRLHFTFNNGSRIVFLSVTFEKAVYRYAGMEYEIIALQNAQEFTERQWEFFTGLNRTATGRRPIMLYEATPPGVGGSWIKRLFIDHDHRDTERAEDYHYVNAANFPNEHLMKDESYRRAYENLPEDVRRAYLEGDWDALRAEPDAANVDPVVRCGECANSIMDEGSTEAECFFLRLCMVGGGAVVHPNDKCRLPERVERGSNADRTRKGAVAVSDVFYYDLHEPTVEKAIRMCHQRMSLNATKAIKTNAKNLDIRYAEDAGFFYLLWKVLQAINGISLARLRELATADAEGRVVVLPCKVGDTLYVPCFKKNGFTIDHVYKQKVDGITVTAWDKCGNGFDVIAEDDSVEVYTNQAEAERALSEAGAGEGAE